MNMEAVCARVDARLSRNALPAGVDLPFAVGGADVGIFGIDLPAGYGCADVEARRGVLFSVVVFFLQALDVEIAADLHIDLFARCLRSDDVGICARGHGEFFFCLHDGRGIGRAFSDAGTARSIRMNADVGYRACPKAITCADPRRARSALGNGMCRILRGTQVDVFLRLQCDVLSLEGASRHRDILFARTKGEVGAGLYFASYILVREDLRAV